MTQREPASYANTDEQPRRESDDLRSEVGQAAEDTAPLAEAEPGDSPPDPTGERHAPPGLEEIETNPPSDDVV